jgi:WD40 repeat protein
VLLVDGPSVNIYTEASLSGSARSVNVVAAATHSAYHIATGSNDGSVKFWDLRHPRAPAFNVLSHGSAVRSLTFGQTPALPVHVVLGLESGMIFRYDLRVCDPTKGRHMRTSNYLYSTGLII